MKSILILTVGGSPQPLVTSIRSNQPDFVWFVCSDDVAKNKGSYVEAVGEGLVCKSSFKVEHPDSPCIATQAGLIPERFDHMRIAGFDNLNDCYLRCLELIEKLHREYPDAKLIIDYTGGTKSMTAGLATAALDDGRCDIVLVTGARQDLRAVTDQTQFVRPVQVWDAQVKRTLRHVENLLGRFDYTGAARLLEETSRRFASDNTVQTIQSWLLACRAFEAWDRFDHPTARTLLQPENAQWKSYLTFLAMLIDQRGHGWELVEDLLMNAQRRVVQQRYDDAVGRLYRALELTAQIWLEKKHGIVTGNVDLDRIPESIRGAIASRGHSDGAIKIGLVDAWSVAAAFTGDPLGDAFSKSKSKLLSFLKTRNESLFAHGSRPVSETDYTTHGRFVEVFLSETIATAVDQLKLPRRATLQQFPVRIDVPND
ncbi:MAG: TIGR02710 family CRISPR-associated CARF protein [Planctomycetia bacterium]|nr:TIGR02710 family CRISPR-associated CARF protein [Planctomycetia bacterium]